MKRFENKVAFVTGAASGIGRATALRLASEGCHVALCDMNETQLEAVAVECRDFGGQVLPLIFDVSVYSACETAINTCCDELGGIDLLCNIAGISQFGHFGEITPDEWQRVVAINLSSVFYLCQLAMPALVERKGNIVNMASSAGLVGQAYTAAYCATKAAVVNLSKSLATEFASKSVRVNAICPGAVDTELAKNVVIPEDADMKLFSKMLPLLERAQPEEIAAAIAYIASPEARFVTGAALSIDGGQVAS